MNTNKGVSPVKSLATRAVAAFVFAAVSTQAYATCNNLAIDVQMPGWRIVGAVVGSDDCEYGEISNLSPTVATLSASLVNGPDCVLNFAGPNAGERAMVRFQQNYCALAAGNITVENLTGLTAVVRTRGGSWTSSRSGTVLVTGFNK